MLRNLWSPKKSNFQEIPWEIEYWRYLPRESYSPFVTAQREPNQTVSHNPTFKSWLVRPVLRKSLNYFRNSCVDKMAAKFTSTALLENIQITRTPLQTLSQPSKLSTILMSPVPAYWGESNRWKICRRGSKVRGGGFQVRESWSQVRG